MFEPAIRLSRTCEPFRAPFVWKVTGFGVVRPHQFVPSKKTMHPWFWARLIEVCPLIVPEEGVIATGPVLMFSSVTIEPMVMAAFRVIVVAAAEFIDTRPLLSPFCSVSSDLCRLMG